MILRHGRPFWGSETYIVMAYLMLDKCSSLSLLKVPGTFCWNRTIDSWGWWPNALEDHNGSKTGTLQAREW